MKQVVLVILDGWGHREDADSNAIAAAHTPFFDSLWSNFPHTTLAASGEAVGLPEGQIGNSEIGHMTIGTGHVFKTDLVAINTAIQTNEFENNSVLQEFLNKAKLQNGAVHLIGLLSDGGVHSHEEHLFALIREADKMKVSNIALHLFTDGRDTREQSAFASLAQLRILIKEIETPVTIASLSGRYFGMDRNENWDRTKKALDTILGKSLCANISAESWIEKSYEKNIFDEFIAPIQLTETTIKNSDSVLFFNFRPDRMRQLVSKLLEQQKEIGFHLASMTEYSADFGIPVLFQKDTESTSLPETLAKHGFSQTHIAESEKYPHVTYFFNGGKEIKYENEEWVCVESRRDIDTHDKAPTMRAHEIGEAVCDAIHRGQNFVLVNIANPDMVGHTANEVAIQKAIEETDKVLEKIVSEAQKQNGIVIVSADHGNAETNKHADGTPHTAHTENRVPFIITDTSRQLRSDGSLADIAPTIYEILKIKNPPECDGLSLFF